jgi:membrane protease YdiL (CAAX protease family)
LVDHWRRRLVGWTTVVALMSLVAYGARVSGERPPKDVAFRWESSIGAALQYAILLVIVLALTWGLDRRTFLALRPPKSWWRAAGISALVIFVVFVVTAVVAQFGNADEEQGLIPESFDSSRAAQFAAYAAVVVLVAPVVEELMFRGVGYALLEPLGQTPAILLTGLAFALVHGLVIGFAVIASFAIGLGYLRGRTTSIYPCILLHALFNAFGLAAGLAS